MDVFSSLDLKKSALLLDVDGTIVDIGPSPDEVQVSDSLVRSLGRLYELSGGAVALVSGRRIGDLDRLFFPLALPSIGVHGAEMRVNDGEIFYWAKPLPTDLRRRLADVASIAPGIVVEDKDYSLALHYRKAPKHAEQLRRHIAAARTAFPAEPTELLLGKAMFEVKRPGISKGESIRKLMAHAPFSGRMPVFIGDDVWIGKEVTITKGARIGHRCIIGIRTVVGAELLQDDSVVVAGKPRIISKRETVSSNV